MNSHEVTINSYDVNAKAISAKFRALGPRIEDIERAITLQGSDKPGLVVEIGSGDGRDAPEIAKRAESYIGVEPSGGLIEIARQHSPELTFIQSTAQGYVFPTHIDVIYAFASLLHVDQDDLRLILERIYKSLRIGGVVYLSLKEADVYTPRLDIDQWGERQFYLYSVEDIENLSPKTFEITYEDHQILGETPWLTVALKKVN